MTEQTQLPFVPQAFFLDRDGTIIEDKHYLCQADLVELIPGAGEAIAALNRAGCQVFVVTNQSGIGRGMFGLAEFQSVQTRMIALLRARGAEITDTRFCPHRPPDPGQTGCACRKPGTGMWESLRDAYGLDPARCVMAGDTIGDLLFGCNAQFAASALLLTGQGEDNARRWNADLTPGVSLTALDLPGGIAKTPPGVSLYLGRDLTAVVEGLVPGLD